MTTVVETSHFLGISELYIVGGPAVSADEALPFLHLRFALLGPDQVDRNEFIVVQGPSAFVVGLFLIRTYHGVVLY